jgi:hypothetical protein
MLGMTPSMVVLVDHAWQAFDKGAIGHVMIDGPEDPGCTRRSSRRRMAAVAEAAGGHLDTAAVDRQAVEPAR